MTDPGSSKEHGQKHDVLHDTAEALFEPTHQPQRETNRSHDSSKISKSHLPRKSQQRRKYTEWQTEKFIEATASGSLPTSRKDAGSSSQAINNARPAAPSYLLIPGLPNEISLRICTFVDKTPEFVHLMYNGAYIDIFNEDQVNAVIRTHKALRQTPELYTNSARSIQAEELPAKLKAAEKLLKGTSIPGIPYGGVEEAMAKFKRDHVPDLGLSPFVLRSGKGRKGIRLRPEVDEFFLDGFCAKPLPEKPLVLLYNGTGIDSCPLLADTYKTLERISNCILGLDDVYYAMNNLRGDNYLSACRKVFGPLLSLDSKVEHWKILVGDFDSRLLPSDLEDIEFSCCEDGIEQVPGSQSRLVTDNQLEKIKFVTKAFQHWAREKHRFNAECIRKRNRFLGGPLLQNDGPAARWLITPQGQKWLETEDGQEWLRQGVARSIDKQPPERKWPYADHAPSWWLATPQGAKWLATDRGRAFLDSALGSAWRQQTREADAWLNQPGTLDSVWFQTTEGKRYLAEKLRGGTALPAVPEFPFPDGRRNYRFPEYPEACFDVLQQGDERYEFALRYLVSGGPWSFSFVRFKQAAQTKLDALRAADRKLYVARFRKRMMKEHG